MRVQSRREILAGMGAVSIASALSSPLQADGNGEDLLLIATNTYPWLTFARRSNRKFELHTDELLHDIARTGINAYEPIITRSDEFDGLGERLEKQHLAMRSIYVNSVLHDPNQAEQSIEDVVEIAEAASKLGTKIVVTNPSPIRWGGIEDKDDQQLRLQAKSLDRLGKALRLQGLTLAYHNHDAELRQGGREFHHMLTATDPANVKLCLDAHWIYRGCGNSEVAVFDALSHYQDRVVELHLRQSRDGIWTESFAMQGDIDYQRLLRKLTTAGIKPHYVLEQSVETKSPNKQTVVEAHRQGRNNLHHALTS